MATLNPARRPEPTPVVPRAGVSLKCRRDALQALGRLFEGAIPPAESLRTVASASPRSLATGLEAAALAIERGATLADALMPSGLVSKGDVGLIRAAETTGALDHVFLELSADIEQLIAIRARLIRGLVYPTIVLVSAILLDPLPRILLFGGSYINAVAPRLIALVGIGVALAVALPWLSRAPAVRQLLWRLPWPATIYVRRVRGHFAAALARALSSGLGFGPAVRLAADATGDPVAHAATAKMGSALKGSLTDAVLSAGLADPSDRVLLASAERAGALDRTLPVMASRQAAAVLAGLRTLTVVLGIVVTLAAVGLSVGAIFGGRSALQEQTDSLMKELQRELPPGFTLE